MYAVILTGGKQYRVKKGDVLSVEKLGTEKGRVVEFDQVLLVEDGKKILVGTPVLDTAVVRAEVIETYKDEKVIVFKKKRRKQYRRTRGHRQQLTRVQVEGIYFDKSARPAAKPEKKKVSEAETKAVAAKPAPEARPEKEIKAPPQAEAGKAAAKAPKKKAAAAKPAKAKAPAKKTESKKPSAKKAAPKKGKTSKE